MIMKQNNIHVIIHNYIESIYVLCMLDEYHNYLISQHYA